MAFTPIFDQTNETMDGAVPIWDATQQVYRPDVQTPYAKERAAINGARFAAIEGNVSALQATQATQATTLASVSSAQSGFTSSLSTMGGRVTALETSQTAQDTKITSLQTTQTSQAATLATLTGRMPTATLGSPQLGYFNNALTQAGRLRTESLTRNYGLLLTVLSLVPVLQAMQAQINDVTQAMRLFTDRASSADNYDPGV